MIVGAALLGICIAAARAEEMRVIAFYEVKKAARPPSMNGKMDDPVWETANRAADYYEYFKVSPGPAPTRTEFRMLYDDKGVYLGIINFERNLDKLVAKHDTRDDQDLWMDDCAEIYFDPTGSSVGFVKFMVNSIGAQADLKRLDAANTLANWDGYEWRVAVGKRPDAWIIEAFFPWSDLERKANPGDVWRFCHMRYAFSSGKFQGATWSPGGSYTSPQNFGYIYFAREGVLKLDDVAAIVSKAAAPPWSLLAGSDVVVCSPSGEIRILNADSMVQEQIEAFKAAMRRAEDEVAKLKDAGASLPGDELEKVRKESGSIPEKNADAMTAMSVLRKAADLRRRADAVYWEAKIRQLADL